MNTSPDGSFMRRQHASILPLCAQDPLLGRPSLFLGTLCPTIPFPISRFHITVAARFIWTAGMEPAKVYRQNIIELEGLTPAFANGSGAVPADGELNGDSKRFFIPERTCYIAYLIPAFFSLLTVVMCCADRKLGITSTTLLIVNRMIGTGIFSTPSTIIQATNSVGASLLFWVLGGFMTLW